MNDRMTEAQLIGQRLKEEECQNIQLACQRCSFRWFYRGTNSTRTRTTTISLALLSDRLRNKPFWIWDKDQHRREDIATKGDCCFTHMIGCPQKNGEDRPLYDYQMMIYDSLITNIKDNNKHLWIKKAAGLGISEFMLRL